MIEGFSRIKFQNALLSWFAEHAREMPWRENKDPYRIWVSEIMLQQTQVKTVHAYFLRFITAFPSLEALAEAPEAKVLKLWEGLGYYSRARNLHRGALFVLEHYQGVIPCSLSEILKIPGIGPYSAGAILSIAYDLPEPAIDGNVIRVFSRIDGISEAFDKAESKRKLEQRVRALIPAADAGDFNQALMELGALVCSPRQPNCLQCPLADFCQARVAGNPEDYPVKGKKTAVKTVHSAVALIRNEQGHILLQHQHGQGIFKNLWCLPWSDKHEVLVDLLEEFFGPGLDFVGPVGMLEHRLTHRLLKMQVYLCNVCDARSVLFEDMAWVELGHPEHAIPVAHKKIIDFVSSQPLLFNA